MKRTALVFLTPVARGWVVFVIFTFLGLAFSPLFPLHGGVLEYSDLRVR